MNQPTCKPAAPPSYGGQAVIEGVMMRGPKGYAVAVRRPNGEIATHYREAPLPSARNKVWGWPFIRGTVSLLDSLVVGVEALVWSANEAVGEDEKISRAEGGLAVVVGALLAVGLFVLLPTVVAGPLRRLGSSSLGINLAEGLLRLAILVGYIWVIGRMADVARVFEYHGAEHKVINAYDAGQPFTPVSADRFSTAHPRCGTSFLLYVVFVSIVLFAFFGWPTLWVRLLTRLALLPVVAGVSYELMKLGARSKSWLGRALIAPGMLLQRMTTRRPTLEQLEVAEKALAALDPPIPSVL